MKRRITYKDNRGRVVLVTRGGKKRQIVPALRPDIAAFRLLDRLTVGPDNGRNHW